MAVRLRMEGCGAGQDPGSVDVSQNDCDILDSRKEKTKTPKKVVGMAKEAAEQLIGNHAKGGSWSMNASQVLEVHVLQYSSG